MSVIDLITRVDAICKKYEKYDVDKQKELNVSGDDAFARLYGVIEADVEAAIQKSEAAATERNRAAAIAMNAEIRRTKARLLSELPKLQRLAFKKVKGVSKDELDARGDLVIVLKERTEAIPDGAAGESTPNGGSAASTSSTGIKFGSAYDRGFYSEFHQQTEESERFRREYEMRRMKQDEGLDVIGEGLDTLKNMAGDMNEELDRQVNLMDEIGEKVDRAASDLRNTNRKLKDTVTQLRSSRNFCLDVVLLSVILGIAASLYNVLK